MNTHTRNSSESTASCVRSQPHLLAGCPQPPTSPRDRTGQALPTSGLTLALRHPTLQQPSGIAHQWTGNSAETHPREGSALGCSVTQPPNHRLIFYPSQVHNIVLGGVDIGT